MKSYTIALLSLASLLGSATYLTRSDHSRIVVTNQLRQVLQLPRTFMNLISSKRFGAMVCIFNLTSD